MRFEVVRTRKRGYPHEGWNWENVVEDLELAAIAEGFFAVGTPRSNELADFVGRASSRLPFLKVPARNSEDFRLLALMGTKPRLAFPHAWTRRGLAMYVWDCWPVDDLRWDRIFRQLSPDFVFFTSRDAADRWSARLETTVVDWLPEAIEPGKYSPGVSLVERPIDLLEVGRRFAEFHEPATRSCEGHGYRHQYPTDESPFIFRDFESLASGIASAKALVCYPASVTHPEGRSQGVETMTYRYLEAVASRTLIVGKIPEEMISLFGFAPGVDMAPSDVEDGLPAVIDSIADYQDLVDRAHLRLLEVGTWQARIKSIRSHVQNLSRRGI